MVSHSVFQIQHSLPDFPYPRVLGLETRTEVSYRFKGKDRPDAPHCIFQFTLSGQGVFSDARGEHVLAPGQGFLCESNDPQTGYRYPPTASQPWRFVYLAFRGKIAHQMVRAMVKRYGGVYRLPLNKGIVHQLRLYASRGRSEYLITASEGHTMIANLLSALVAASEAGMEKAPENILVRRARDLIHTLIEQPINVSEIADELDVTREHLTRVFRSQIGITPYQYILRKKMLLACQLLREDPVSVSEVSERLGYEVPAHFTRTFKRVVRVAPSRFKEAGIMPVL